MDKDIMLLDIHNLIPRYKMNITGVIHIGGHQGSEIDEYLKIPTIQNIVLFEPDEISFKILKDKCAPHTHIVCINKALGPFECKMLFNTSDDNSRQCNSLLKPKIHLQQYPGIKFNEEPKEIKVYPLDMFSPSSILNFINIDTQGFEFDIFRGASKTLDNIDYVMAEVNRAELYENCMMVDDIDYILSKHNLVRVETAWAGGTWGDALYIRKELV